MTCATAETPVFTESLVSVCSALLINEGLPGEAAARTARGLVEADMSGHPAHGIAMLPLYVRRMRAGSVSNVTRGSVVQSRNATAVIDGHHALGMLIGDQAMALSVEKAKEHGIGVVGVRHAFHFGAAGRYATAAANDGCIGIAMSNTRPLLSAPEGTERLVGTNPLAISIPSAAEVPVTLDLAFSEAAMGKVRLAAETGEAIPGSWAKDSMGRPTTDASEAIEGSLQPIAGFKGFGLALMVDLICGLVSGGAMGAGINPLFDDLSTPYDCSQVFLAIDIGHFGPVDELRSRTESEIDRIRESRRRDADIALTTPGERSWKRRFSNQDAVRVSRVTLRSLADQATDQWLEGQIRGLAHEYEIRKNDD